MFIRKNETNPYLKYIARNGTKKIGFWKHLLKHKKIHVFNGDSQEFLITLQLFKDIIKIKKVLDSFKYPWEFDIVLNHTGKLLLKGFSFIVDEVTVTSEDNPDEQMTKKELIYYVSLEEYEGRIKISQPSFLTSFWEKNIYNGSYSIHPHVGSSYSVTDRKYLTFPSSSLTPFYQESNVNSKVNSNICRGAGSVGQLLTGAILEEQTPEMIEYYLINLIGLSRHQSDGGGPYWFIRNLRPLQKASSRSNLVGNFLQENEEPTYEDYFSQVLDKVVQEITSNHLREVPCYADPYDFIVVIDNEDFKALVINCLSEEDMQKISYHLVSVKQVSLYNFERLKQKAINSEINPAPPFVTLKYKEGYFQYEGKQYEVKKEVATETNSGIADLFIAIDSNPIKDIRKLISQTKEKIEKYVRQQGETMAKQSFKSKIQSAINSRERSVFENTGTLF